MCLLVVDWRTTAYRHCRRYACSSWTVSQQDHRGCQRLGGLRPRRRRGSCAVASSAGSTPTPFNCASAAGVTTAGVCSSTTAPLSAVSRSRSHSRRSGYSSTPAETCCLKFWATSWHVHLAFSLYRASLCKALFVLCYYFVRQLNWYTHGLCRNGFLTHCRLTETHLSHINYRTEIATVTPGIQRDSILTF